MAPSPRTPFTLLALALAALVSSWNPASAPLGLAVGLLAGGLGLKARRDAGETAPPLRAALALALLAVVLSAAVVARTAGAGRDSEGRPIVEGIPRSERLEALDRAEEATRGGREAARKELDSLGPGR